MASENVIRKKAKEKLAADGWIISMPKRQRFGATTTTLPEGKTFDNGKQYKGHDDFFSVFDGIAWKDGEIKFIQWTSHSNVSERIKKIKKFISSWDISLPRHVTAEVWGYTDREGFTRIEQVK